MTRASTSAFARIAMYRCKPINKVTSSGLSYSKRKRKPKRGAKSDQRGSRTKSRFQGRSTSSKAVDRTHRKASTT
jgi:phage FluMu protein Com